MKTIPTAIEGNFDFDSYEYHPCIIIGKSDGREIVEQVDDNEESADFWSVYGHLRSGGLECLCDCPNRVVAELITIGLLATLNPQCPQCGDYNVKIDKEDGYFRICQRCDTNFEVTFDKTGMQGWIVKSFR